jgi:hypothetical protein
MAFRKPFYTGYRFVTYDALSNAEILKLRIMQENDQELWKLKNLEGYVCGVINATSPVLPDETEENHKIQSG